MKIKKCEAQKCSAQKVARVLELVGRLQVGTAMIIVVSKIVHF
jgi:hypothetical protein